MKRTGFKRKTIERSRTVHKPLPEHLRRNVTMGRVADVVVAAPKTIELRSPALLDMARGRPCLFRLPGLCNGDPATVVACHSNQGAHGKAGARKADDCFSAWGCYACHTWLDQGDATQEEKVAAFEAALRLQLDAWRQVEADPTEQPRFRRAASWALEHAA